MEFKLCLTIAAVLLIGAATAYSKTLLTIRSILRRKASMHSFVVASQGNLSNGQLSAKCDGIYSSDPQAKFTLVDLGNSAMCIQFNEYALKAKNDTGKEEVVFERQSCKKNPSSQFWFRMNDANGVITWKSLYLEDMYLGCSADRKRLRLRLINVTDPNRGAPELQFSIRYKGTKRRIVRRSVRNV